MLNSTYRISSNSKSCFNIWLHLILECWFGPLYQYLWDFLFIFELAS